ncbi:MAG: galactose mutarotase [Rhodobacteraceae bacterium]|nr:galactose mutarotase [Paracoccaceae bacterium]
MPAATGEIAISGGGLTARLLPLGATLRDLRLDGHAPPLVIGADDPRDYQGALIYAGAVVGPVANRIAGARAALDGRVHRFEANEGGVTTLHSGHAGLHARHWAVTARGGDVVTFAITLPDGEGGFPGHREVRATYRLLPHRALQVELTATSDAPTWINLAQHSYWNLDGGATIAAHRLRIAADRYLPVDAAGIPLAPEAVAGTRYDFRRAIALGDAPPLDHNFCLSGAPRDLTEVAELIAPSGLCLHVATTEPGLQVYDGRHFAVPAGAGLGGRGYGAHAGLAIEAQGWPDAPNRPDFPPVTLRPGETYRQITRFRLERAGPP